MTATDAVRYEVENGIVTLTIDDPSQSANTMNETYRASMEAAVNRLADEIAQDADAIKGVVVTSAKKTFFAGGDLKLMTQATPADAQALFDNVESIKATLRKLETLGKPVVAAINGAALGGGLEIALACHHRIAAEGRYEIGLPEVTLGLLPGGGGVTRTTRMFGIQDALMNVLLQGQRNKPEKALKIGLIDEIVPADELISKARAWVEANAGDEDAAKQPWDRPGHKIPGGTPSNPKLAAFLPSFPANLKKQLKGAPYIAPRHIMSAVVEGAQVDFDTASRIESRYLVNLLIGQQFKNMTQAFFFDLGAINAGGSRPDGIAERKAEKLAILGAGMMGAGIAYEAARAGIEVVLKDVSVEAAEKGKGYSEGLLAKQVQRGRLTEEKKAEILGRIHPTADYADLAGCDFVVEAVFESVELKHSVFGELEPIVNGDALLGSNTSTLPITTLAEGVQRPEDFIGIHFFSPVDKMQLVEIIVGEKTSDEALARAIDFTKQIRKIPIVVNDSRGFFTSRVFGTLVMEGVEMLAEGVDPVVIERAAQLAGFPGQPLAMSDEVSLTLQQKIEGEARKAAAAEGKELPVTPASEVVNQLVELGRPGKAGGAGFYEYPEGGKKYLWPELWNLFVKDDVDVPLEDIEERLTFIMAIETVRCFEEGVIRQVADANIGSIFGIGFPPVHGGALQYVNGYVAANGEIGIKAFTERAQELAEKYGERFSPPALLLEKAEKGEKIA
ncbi:enoyl-CoA hydratase/isomerase family protein [Aeromicrobium tamlense]|uniref:3-hydroxyacyl-CoA dehydrogenase/enoyl-CoA hydratase/3-hydroxybutyryl-CoA epimerase n=1 Tax=Aeromicrobium tamlense TaxID=375541 RepID=A0A8I0FWD1_9ACTN|nr:3-hydroxyacyl-CoA dehydrogenase NAD-binding domain-containing protein [Aeromicrobium tamlense]MBD1269868.1 enoyl-CoA hydratase/isomerase family protein [Aeromicrobium tamlense]NYI39475.1 3-hydroxyacyl-CoA dehydrogenase/enoyl-CoA hydratase/3-hydroxybutyryl-CoA epimerase [Aeromicrobium tamlense]